MEAAKPLLHMTLREATSKYAEAWNITDIMGPVKSITPLFMTLLTAAVIPCASAKGKETEEDTVNSRNQLQVRYSLPSFAIFADLAIQSCSTIASQVHYI